MAAPVSAPRRSIGNVEFIALLSMIMALAALAIDLMLPAFGEMRSSFGLAEDSNQVAGVVTAFLLGLAVAQVVYGPLADSLGRRPMLYVGFALYALGAAGAALAPTLELLLLSRFIWGIGAAGPRVIALSIVRDRYEGRRMARVMSFIFAVFILVPVTTPSMGAVIVALAPWRWVFWFCVLFVGVVALWAMRLPETLDPHNRIALSWSGVRRAAGVVLNTRITMGYMIAMTFAFGAFVSYLASSEIIIADVFDRESQFPFIFGGLAAVMGITALGNAKIVGWVGPRRLVHLVMIGYVTAAAAMVVLSAVTDGRPPFWAFIVMLGVMLVFHALFIPNVNTVAMTPVGEVAGTASALIGTLSTAGGALLGLLLDRAYDGTVAPHSIGFLLYGGIALGVVTWTERGRLLTPERPSLGEAG